MKKFFLDSLLIERQINSKPDDNWNRILYSIKEEIQFSKFIILIQNTLFKIFSWTLTQIRNNRISNSLTITLSKE